MKQFILRTCLLVPFIVECAESTTGSIVVYEDTSSQKALLSIVERIDLVPLQTEDAPLLGSHVELFLTNDSFIIVDIESARICRYNRDGAFLNMIGIRGNGPGEYIDICNVQIVGEEIIVFSNPDKILHFNLDGECCSEEHADRIGAQSWLVPEGILSYYGFGSGKEYRMGLLEDNKETFFLKDETNVLHFSAGAPVFYEWRDTVYFTDAYNPSVMIYTNKKVDSYVTFDFKSAAIPTDFYDFEDPFAAMEFLLARRFSLIQRYLLNDRYQFVEVFIQDRKKMKAQYGVTQKEEWTWFSVGELGVDPLAGSFRAIDNQAIYCLIDSSMLGRMDHSCRTLVSNSEAIERVSIDDNPVLAILTLK